MSGRMSGSPCRITSPYVQRLYDKLKIYFKSFPQDWLKPFPQFFHGAFAPRLVWCRRRRPWLPPRRLKTKKNETCQVGYSQICFNQLAYRILIHTKQPLKAAIRHTFPGLRISHKCQCGRGSASNPTGEAWNNVYTP